MDYLYCARPCDNALFQEEIIDGYNHALKMYSFDVKKKTDSLLIQFLNNFQEKDFYHNGLPDLFIKVLLFFSENKEIRHYWELNRLSVEFIFQWITSGAWMDNCSLINELDYASPFFIRCILEDVLKPLFYAHSVNDVSNKQEILKIIMATDWKSQKVRCTYGKISPQNTYLRSLHLQLMLYSTLWHFINHQATFNVDSGYGIFPKKKVRYFCRNYLGIDLDYMQTDTFMEAIKVSENCRFLHYDPTTRLPVFMSQSERERRYYMGDSLEILKEINNPQKFCSAFDSEYQHYLKTEEHYRCKSIVDIVSFSLLHFAIYKVPVRRCTLCGRFYIPVKNSTTASNFCHRPSNENKQKSCSSYHSHNQKSFGLHTEEDPYIKLEKSIKSFRSTLSQSLIINKDNGHLWIDFLKKTLVVVNKAIKRDSSQIEMGSLVLQQAKEIYKTLKSAKELSKPQAEEINIRNDTLISLSAKLKAATIINDTSLYTS